MKSFPYILWKYAHTWASDFKCSNIVLASPLNSYNTKSIVILHFRSKLRGILSTYFIYIVRYNLHYYWLCIFWECTNTSADRVMKSCCFRNCPEMCTLPHIVGQEALLNQVYLSETKHRFQNWPFYLLLQNLGAHSKTFVFVYVDIFEKTAQPFVCAVYPKHNKGIIRNKFMQKVINW